MGGTSAIPQTYFVPSLEGKLVVTIPDAAGPEEKGGTTVAKNVKNNVVGRIFYGYGAAGGKADESLEAPSAGEHSQFSLKEEGLLRLNVLQDPISPADMLLLRLRSKNVQRWYAIL